MKKIILIAAMSASSIAVAEPISQAGPTFIEQGDVIKLSPRYVTVTTPREKCRDEVVRSEVPVQRETRSGGGGIAGTVLGGVAGGALGSQIGGGSGRTVATIAGTIGGAMIGDHVSSDDGYASRSSERREVRGGANNVAGTVLGGLAGGALGSQVGGGTGRTVATIAGAIGGAMVGDRVTSSDESSTVSTHHHPREVRRTICERVNDTVERPDGYEVTYMYKGKRFMTVMREDPGPRVRLRVTVTPEEIVR